MTTPQPAPQRFSGVTPVSAPAVAPAAIVARVVQHPLAHSQARENLAKEP